MLCTSPMLRTSLRRFSTAVRKYTLPDLPYDAGALAPAISGEIMTIHHSKHHNAYITNLNVALEKYAEAEAKGDLAAMVALQSAIKFNGGGHVNHSIFWTNLAPVASGGGDAGKAPTVSKMIDAQWGSLDAFKSAFSAQSVAVQGSGWGWLGYDKAAGSLKIATTANQDPLSTLGLVPLLGVDVWEHAYYLQYKNVRPDYLKSIWSVVNWANVEERLAKAK
ncbi:Manganese/iron superoxide dismutase [Pavlovales sp. CCMP2436]|nr:Manganese/iron superoxide dismutase [Pavlovales sp. CCMP2436]